MRLMHHLLLVGLVLGATSAHAASVLLPTDDKEEGSSAGNLGLSPSVKPTPPAPTPTPATPIPAPVATQSAPSVPANNVPKAADTTPPASVGAQPSAAEMDKMKKDVLSKMPTVAPIAKPTATKIKPGGTLGDDVGDMGEAGAKKTALEAFMSKGFTPTGSGGFSPEAQKIHDWADAEHKKKFSRPPTFFDDNDIFTPEKSYTDSMEKGLDVSIGEGYIWGASDVEVITNALGYPAKQIPSHCQLRMNTEIVSDKGRYNYRIFSAEKQAMKFNGTVSNLNFAPWAVCDIPKGELPQNPSLIGKVGTDKYSLSLAMQGSCDLPKKQAKGLEVVYKGNGKLDCKYQ